MLLYHRSLHLVKEIVHMGLGRYLRVTDVPDQSRLVDHISNEDHLLVVRLAPQLGWVSLGLS